MDLKLMCGHSDVYSMRCYQVDNDNDNRGMMMMMMMMMMMIAYILI